MRQHGLHWSVKYAALASKVLILGKRREDSNIGWKDSIHQVTTQPYRP